MKRVFLLFFGFSLSLLHIASFYTSYRPNPVNLINLNRRNPQSSFTSSILSYLQSLSLLSQSPRQDVSTTEVLEQLDPTTLPLIFKYVDAGSPATSTNVHESRLYAVLQVSNYLTKWSEALSIGLIPDEDNAISSSGDSTTGFRWPEEPFFSELVTVFRRMQIPELAERHKEIIPSIVKNILSMAIEFKQRAQERLADELSREADQNIHEEQLDYINWDLFTTMDEDDQYMHNQNAADEISSDSLPSQQRQQQDIFEQQVMAQNILRQFESTWSTPLTALAAIDDIFGATTPLPSWIRSGQAQIGCGVESGLWQHSGWQQMRELQNLLRGMFELRLLVSSLGKRPAVDGDEKRKMPPQRDGSNPGVSRSPYTPTELTGIRRSNTIEGLLPSEMMLLAKENNHSSENHASRSRLLFRVRMAERLLSSYEISGWEERPSRPKLRPWRSMQVLPTSVGGPVIVCLDTSWSMTGPRERLAKAVVLECATFAAKSGRPFYLMAFSGSADLAECELPLLDAKASKDQEKGMERLVDFLSSSFGGGTDVTRPLERAIELMERESAWAAADLLLVTDGELQMPPVDQELLTKLERMESEKGLEIHGLLVGKSSSVPLSLLCTDWDGRSRVHDFLSRYDELIMFAKQAAERQAASTAPADERDDGSLKSASSSPRKMTLYGERTATDVSSYRNSRYKKQYCRSSTKLFATCDDKIEHRLSEIDKVAKQLLESRFASPLLAPTTNEGNDTMAAERRATLQAAIRRIEMGLVERNEEAKLLILTALCREHLLLLGPPGTGKSELGRRLANAAGSHDTDTRSGWFFERLLTRYSTPEELFGPLSLAALEEDKYIRNIAGYLPTASVAFLDEIFKANSAILNSLLTILNERKFDNGNERIDVPLIAVVGASNELPDSEELEALYDRFLFRKRVSPVSDQALFTLMDQTLSASPAHSTGDDSVPTLLPKSMVDRLLEEASAVIVSPQIKQIVKEVKIYLRDEVEPSVYISDRRILKSIKMLCVSAASHGRREVSLADCLLLKHVLWQSPDGQPDLIKRIWKNLASEDSTALFYLLTDLRKKIGQFSSSGGAAAEEKAAARGELTAETNILINILAQKVSSLRRQISECRGRARQGVGYDHLWLSDVDNSALRQNLVPILEKSESKVYSMLSCALAFEAAIRELGGDDDNDNDDDGAEAESLVEEAWRRLQLALDPSSHGNSLGHDDENRDDNDDDSSSLKAALKMNLTKKEAQSRLSAEDFKLWKKAQRSLRKSASSNYYNEDGE